MKPALKTFTCSLTLALSVLAAMGGAYAQAVWQTNGAPVCTVTASQESPYVIGVGSGETIITWADARNSDYDIYIQKLDSDGQPLWTAGGVKVCGSLYDQQFPAVVGDGAGGAIVVWQDGRLGDDGLDIYAQRVLANGTMAWQVNGVPVCSHVSGITDPPMAFSHVVVADGSGGVIVAWRDTRNDPVNGNTEIYTQKISGSGAAAWTANGVKVLGFGTTKWSTRNPVIASDGSGGAVIAWQDTRNLAASGNDLYIQRVTSTGSPAWTVNGVIVCNAAGDQGYPDIVDMASGSTAITWEDKRSGEYDIYAQRFNASGISQWGANGRLICGSANDQRTPRVCSDGGSGVVIAWTDKRSSTLNTDVYAQRLDASGSALWVGQGAAICTAAGSQTRIRMAPSVSGLTILTWMDTRNETLSGVYDLYGQMIDSSAALKWDPAGISIAAITGNNQRLHTGASDIAGSLCVAWEDDRNSGDWDIYAQKLSPWISTATIAEVKQHPADAPISVTAHVVTGSYSGFFYIQEPGRFAGIRVEYPQTFAPGTLVSVAGTLGSGIEPFIKASLVKPVGSGDMPGALGISASMLGSSSIGQVPGLTTVGLLVRSWGRVTAKPTPEEPYIVFSDGAREVHAYGSADVEIGDTVVVTGICSSETTPSGTMATILTREPSDIHKISP